MGMQGGMDHATLQFWNGELAWRIAPAFDPNMRVYDVAATPHEAWQTSWDEFVKEVQRLYDAHADDKEFGRRFSGKTVHWQGEVEGVATNDSGKSFVALRMPGTIKLPGGKVLAFDNLLLTLKGNGQQQFPNRIRFRATLFNGHAQLPSPVFEFSREGETKSVLQVLLEDDWSLE